MFDVSLMEGSVGILYDDVTAMKHLFMRIESIELRSWVTWLHGAEQQ